MSEQPILCLGSSGYIGSAFVEECREWSVPVYAATRAHDFYDEPSLLERLLDVVAPSLVVNSAAYIPVESVDLCKDNPAETIKANVFLPALIAKGCRERDIPLMH